MKHSNPGTNDTSRDTLHVPLEPAKIGSEPTELECFKERQQAWEAFACCAVSMIPVLKKQMEAVTQQTQRAATDLMTHFSALTLADETSRSTETAAHLSQIVMTMQFQDITQQKLEHVAQALDQWDKHLQALSDSIQELEKQIDESCRGDTQPPGKV